MNKKFHLLQESATQVKAPLLMDYYANLECKVINASLSKKYNIFIFEVIRAWIRSRMIHHTGNEVFVMDGDVINVLSKKK